MLNGTGRRFQRRQWVWIMLMVDIVLFMLLMTLGIIALQVGQTQSNPNDKIEISIIDEKGTTWTKNTQVEIFNSSYVNDKGETTIESSNGEPVVAPGFDTNYSFALYNTNDVAIGYSTNVNFLFTVNTKFNEEFSSLPIKVRLYTVNDNGIACYLIGGEKSGEPLGVMLSGELNDNFQLGVLGKSCYQKFFMELWWDFESGNYEDDVRDTLLGNIAAENGSAIVTMNIEVNAWAHSDPNAVGGTPISSNGSQTNGNLVSWLWVIFLLINGSVLIFYVAWLLNKRSIEAYEKSEKENTESGTAT